MRTLLWVTGLGLLVSGCASTAPSVAWGKPGVSRMDYGTDIGTCMENAATQNSGGNGAHSAGGVSGTNNSAGGNSPGASGSAASSAAAATGGASTAAGSAPTPAGGTYSGMASADYAQRAVTQQRTQQMAVQRARADALKGCLAGRGYQEFELTAEQRAHLETLKKGSTEYHEYLYQLGSDAEIIAKQGRAPGE